VAGTDLRVLGPNSEGYCTFDPPVAAGFSPTLRPELGPLARHAGHTVVVAQSGGLGFALFSEGAARGLGFSHVVSTGNEVDLDSLDFVAYLLEDPRTRVLLLFVEGFRNARRFPELARRAAALRKPIVVAKVGRSPAAQRAAASHTAHLVGRDDTYDAVFRRWGVIRASDQEEAVDAALVLDRAPLPPGPRAAAVTFSGGTGVWMADALEAEGLPVPLLSEELQARLRKLVPPFGATTNPVDVTAQVIQTAGGVTPVIRLLFECDEVDLVVLVVTLTDPGPMLKEEAALRALLAGSAKPLLVYAYTQPSAEARELVDRLPLTWFPSSRRTARAARALVDYGRFLRSPAATADPSESAPSWPTRGRLLPASQGALLEADAKDVLRRWGLPVPRGRLATSAEAAAAAAAELAVPVAIKVQALEVGHKTDQGGVVLGVTGASEAERVAGDLLRRFAGRTPAGVLVEEMAAPGTELVLSAVNDPDFGPLVMAGRGGIDVEVDPDTVLAPAPLDQAQAMALIRRLRGWPLLARPRGRPRADVEALGAVLARLSQLALAHQGYVGEVELNPVLVHEAGRGVTVVDALITALDPAGATVIPPAGSDRTGR
jgi:acyl-CoA synthetase (NDP forming)